MSNPLASVPENSKPLENEQAVCDLCGLRLVSHIQTLTLKDRTYRFCCIGCRQVFRMLTDATENPDISSFKNTEIFKQCQALGIIPSSENETAEQFSDRGEAPQDSSYDIEKDGFLKVHFSVEGMWCPACAWVIE
ncbi:MAG: TRASH domain-containing protein, partial [Desulfobacterales bacterium]